MVYLGVALIDEVAQRPRFVELAPSNLFETETSTGELLASDISFPWPRLASRTDGPSQGYVIRQPQKSIALLGIIQINVQKALQMGRTLRSSRSLPC